MNLDNMLGVFLSAVAFLKEPIKEVASGAIKDAYEATRNYLRKKLIDRPEAIAALDAAIEKPQSAGRKTVFLEETALAGLESDAKLAQLINALSKLLPSTAVEIHQSASVSGRNNRVQQAGRDITNVEKIVRKNLIQPGPEHISGEQKEKLREVIREVAERTAGEDGAPNYASAYSKLATKLGVSSYLLIKKEDFESALSFLRQQRAINRSKLRRSNPGAYSQDFYSKIHACRSTLGWNKLQLYQYAAEKLALKKPITSLKQCKRPAGDPIGERA